MESTRKSIHLGSVRLEKLRAGCNGSMAESQPIAVCLAVHLWVAPSLSTYVIISRAAGDETGENDFMASSRRS